jgi:putative oxidoreductase
MIRELLATAPTWVTLPLRLALGIIFIGHGAQKVFGVWGGPGWSKFVGFPPPYGFMRPAWLWMGAAAVVELLGGVLVLLGLFTRVGAFLIGVVMLVAMFGVHWKNGLFLPTGYEYTLALVGMAAALVVAGGGRASVDERLHGARGRRKIKY